MNCASQRPLTIMAAAPTKRRDYSSGRIWFRPDFLTYDNREFDMRVEDNDMKWDCDIHGCFNKTRRLKFKKLSNSVSGYTDIDGIVETYGNALMIEWKGYSKTSLPNNSIIPRAQRIMFERITRGRMISVICVAGNAEDMSVKAMCWIVDGKWGRWRFATLDYLNKVIKRWAEWSENNSRRWRA